MKTNDTGHLVGQATQAQRAGRVDEAARLFHRVIAECGEHPVALNALGMRALVRGRREEAVNLFHRAIAADPRAPDLWMNLAKAKREQGDAAGERAALEGALAIDRRHFMALVRMAELLERIGDEAEAAGHWSGVLAMAEGVEERTPALESMLAHARDRVTASQRDFAAAIDGGLSEALGRLAPSETRRVTAAIDHALGRRQIYANECAGLHVPFLPADEFFDRAHFPWLAGIEAQTGAIRAELEALLADDKAGFLPYIAMEPGTPANKWTPLDHKMDWGALHLWKDGRRNDAVCARAPKTAAAIEALPLSDLPGRTPTIFFSLLEPGAHLPAHTGVSNVRTIIHLPLIVPPGCSFRVGGETRDWVEGEAWAFDDTIEHEAWNRSDRLRAILIFDVWNPHIREEERALLRRFYEIAGGAGQGGNAAIGLSE
ncbi:aspartyl/asparaginyl beta-hydroxylase domain-containing protein [Sphingomonas sp. BIUV-7]|uniref:Aspartyl/asparaginyl beta-hydroxylase domain-containing protein n=1 Tax=Sphingomonas natans TaxID=3063330 RepID=A0ABT8Y6E2_9SPHN|nr:aspartyl/asparaginyl beta-hydroxylase domain-containing protein [Sphingomonas sp. BIUV-7]MDO6413294.1 aspartyl/asparaginyl beta-hydroxylase domain-containing protein [Sphingomonas sp. BIUV-7]